MKARLHGLPSDLRLDLVASRNRRGWSQAELGRRVGLPQMHISRIEAGKVSPHFDTLLDVVRVLGYDLLLVPRALTPAVQALVRDHAAAESEAPEEGPLYRVDGADEEPER